MLLYYFRNYKFDFLIKIFKWLLRISLSSSVNFYTLKYNIKKNVINILYKIIDDLFYFDDDKRDLRFYVLIVIKVEVFKLTYNEIKYFDYARTYERLIEKFYIFNIITKFYKFIRYCFHC